ncbi:MAG: thiolase family protein [Bacillota bacterium]
MKGQAAIAGLGITQMGKVYGSTSTDFAVEAISLALEDAGLKKDDLDGLLINVGVSGLTPGTPGALGIDLQNYLGLCDLKLLNVMNGYGSTTGAMVQFAAMACATGMTNAVACVFADNPLVADKSTGSAYASVPRITGLASLNSANGIFGVNPHYAMAARRHMELYGTTSEQLGAIAVAQRKWAMMNSRAQMRTPMTLEDHQASRMIVEPFHLFDCCLVSNGGVAVIVTSSERARSLRQPPVYIWGWGQGHPGSRPDKMVRTGGVVSSQTAYRMAGITPTDVNICEFYDCYTYTVLVTLEDYRFCSKGEGGPFVEDGKTGPGGSLPVNTGGGQLSSYYMWGMTPLSEAVIQARGQGGERQAPKNDIIIVSGNGGVLDYHSTLVLSPLPS